jgi:hypothetical protein
MDQDDRSINLEEFLSTGEGRELKEFFKHEFASSLNKDFGDSVQINYPSDNVSRFISLYGFDEFFDKLPKTLKRFDFEKSSRGVSRGGSDETIISRPLHPKILNFRDLEVLHIEGLLSELPVDIGDKLKNLQFVSIPNNPELKSLPESLADVENLQVINIKNNSSIVIGPKLQEKIDNGEIVLIS